MLLQHLSRLEKVVSKSTEEAFEPFIERFNEDVSKYGFKSTFLSWSNPGACGCMGPRDGNPYCHCEMLCKTAAMFGEIIQK